MNENLKTVLHGDRFITTQDIKKTGWTTWSAPCSGSFECTIPAGTILVARSDQQKGSIQFACIPEKYKELEKLLVPTSERYHLKYSGYLFRFRMRILEQY